MARRLLIALSLFALACSTPSSASEPAPGRPAESTPAASRNRTVYGTAPTDRPTTPLAELLEHPERYEGREVRVQGPVQAVCRHRGCWMDIGAADEAGGRVHVRSLDHSIAFPREAVGQLAEVEGTVEAMPGAPGCGGHGEDSPACGTATNGRRVQLNVRGAVLETR